MATTFNTVVPISRKTWPGVWVPRGSCSSWWQPEVSTPAYPTNKVVTHTPSSTEITILDPTRTPDRNWKKIKASGAISFTPYSRSKKTVNRSIIGVPHLLAGWNYTRNDCGGQIYRYGPFKDYTSWTENVSIESLSMEGFVFKDQWSPALVNHSNSVRNAISTTQQAAFANATSTYDVLSELAEAKETLSFLQGLVGQAANAIFDVAVTDSATFKKARGLNAKQMLRSSDRAVRSLGSRWMAFRYAIMPIVYSIKDVNDLLKGKDSVYKRDSSSDIIFTEVDASAYPIPTNVRDGYVVGSIETKIKSGFKVGYDRGSLQRLFSQTTFNPFLTAWELIPLSFVIDWFINVGDAIIAATRYDSSSQSLGWTAVKETMTVEHWFVDTTRDTASISIPLWLGDSYYDTHRFDRSTVGLLQSVEVVSYNRTVFKRPEAKLNIDIFLNWKRIIDSLVLSYQPIKKLLRSL
ncbi:MAG: maturation protein [Sanya duin-like virus 1]|nr:MAG: maturation protein [Sanya duin-like virus 1]